MLEVGQIVQVLEIKTDKRGKAKVRHEQGWTPMKAPDGRPVLEYVGEAPVAEAPPQAGGTPPQMPPQAAAAPEAAPEAAAAAAAAPIELPEEDEYGELPFKLLKGNQGFGINIDDRGVVIGYTGQGSPAELAGVPVGTLLVRVNGDPVLGKAEVIGAIRAAGAAQCITFAFMTPQAYMARKNREENPPVEEGEPPEQDTPAPAQEPAMEEAPAYEEPEAYEQPEPAAPAAAEEEAEVPGLPDFGAMEMMEDLAASAPEPVEVVGGFGEEAPAAGIRRGKKKKKKAPSPTPEELEERAQKEARVAAEAAEAEAAAIAQAEAEAEQARYEAEQAEALRLEQERVAAAEAARIAAEEEAKRLAMQSVSYKITEMKKQVGGFNEEHAQLLQQISHQRSAIASDEAKLAGLESEIEQAMAREDYDHADRVQSDVDALKARVGSGKQTLSDNEHRAKQYDTRKSDMLNQSVQLHTARVAELLAKRDEELQRCAGFVNTYGGQLAEAENQLRDITQQIGLTLKTADAEEIAVDTEQITVDTEVDKRTETIRADKVEHEKTILTIDEQIAELERQIQVKQTERQAETDAINGIDGQIYEERQNFSTQLTDIAERTELIKQQRDDCEAKKQAMDIQWEVLDEHRADAQDHRTQYANVITEICEQTDQVQQEKAMLSFWLICIEEDQSAEQGAVHRQAQLKVKFDKVSADLQEVASANSEFADGMRVLTTESTQHQAALARYEQQLPDLEGQKAAAASTRNFKEASRLNGEIKRVNGEQEQATAKMSTLSASISQKEAQNADVSMKLTAMQKAVDVAQQALHTDRFETLKSQIAKLKARVASADEVNAASFQAQLDVASGEAKEITRMADLGSADAVDAEQISLPEVAAVSVDIVALPPPVPRMTEEEATKVLRTFVALDADLNAQLEAAMAAEEYDLCDELGAKIDNLTESMNAAEESLGDKAADLSMSNEDAEALLATYDADLSELEVGLEAAMGAEDYEQCDALQLKVDSLKSKKATADAAISGGPAPPDVSTRGDLKSMAVPAVPHFGLDPIPVFESSAVEPAPQPASMYRDTGAGASMYGDTAGAGGSMYGSDPNAGASMYGDTAGAGESMYGDTGAAESMYGDSAAGGGGESMYGADPNAGASMYADTAGAGESMYDDPAAAPAGGGGFDFVVGSAVAAPAADAGGFGFSVGADAAPAEEPVAGGFGFIAGGADAAPAEAEPAAGGFGFIGGGDTAAAAPAPEAGGFGFIGGGADAAPAAEPAAGGFGFIGGAGDTAGASLRTQYPCTRSSPSAIRPIPV